MQKRMYRFEIVRGVSNAVYQAYDTARGSSVTLYEWTPDAQDLDACLKILNGLTRSEEYEVFSSGASLYMAAATEPAGHAALSRLRDAGLFKGTFEGAGSAAPPPPPPPPPMAPAPKSAKRDIPLWLAPLAISIVILLPLLGLLRC